MSSPTGDGAAQPTAPTQATGDSSLAAQSSSPLATIGDPVALDTHEVNHNLQISTMSEGTYASFSDGKKTIIPMAVSASLLTSIATRTMSPPPSDLSGITGWRSASDGIINEDPLDPLPKPWKHTEFTNPSSTLLSMPPAFVHLSYPVRDTNVQDTRPLFIFPVRKWGK